VLPVDDPFVFPAHAGMWGLADLGTIRCHTDWECLDFSRA
jgi:hypothetical protein